MSRPPHPPHSRSRTNNRTVQGRRRRAPRPARALRGSARPVGVASRAGRTAPDGSPYPDRTQPTFERDIQAMFTHIATGYDRFDHAASLGSDLLWRPRAIWAVDRFRSRSAPHRILDVGCGTGGLSALAARFYPGAHVVGIDVTRRMLTIARERLGPGTEGPRMGWARATALRLPFPSGSFDLAMSAFVVRNLPRLPEALAELRRILAPGGTLLTLEITEPPSPTVRWIFHAYFDSFVPWLGAAVGSAGPYRYLPESLRNLPDRRAMMELFRTAGFARIEARPQSLGIVTSFLAEAGHDVPPRAVMGPRDTRSLEGP
jgi:demethylmenaquinone methyltransferase/2-methoxy-6-polyprenyl-1,4-benzoquinol methylase